LQHREFHLRLTMCAERVAMFKAVSGGIDPSSALRLWRTPRAPRPAARAARSCGNLPATSN
jgi:cytidine deaminase